MESDMEICIWEVDQEPPPEPHLKGSERHGVGQREMLPCKAHLWGAPAPAWIPPVVPARTKGLGLGTLKSALCCSASGKRI